MTLTTATTYGAHYSHDTQYLGVLNYLNGGDYTPDQEAALADALMAAHVTAVNDRLPDGVTWHPSTSEFIHPVSADLPDQEAIAAVFFDAWQSVEARHAEIEAATFPGAAGT